MAYPYNTPEVGQTFQQHDFMNPVDANSKLFATLCDSVVRDGTLQEFTDAIQDKIEEMLLNEAADNYIYGGFRHTVQTSFVYDGSSTICFITILIYVIAYKAPHFQNTLAPAKATMQIRLALDSGFDDFTELAFYGPDNNTGGITLYWDGSGDPVTSINENLVAAGFVWSTMTCVSSSIDGGDIIINLEAVRTGTELNGFVVTCTRQSGNEFTQSGDASFSGGVE